MHPLVLHDRENFLLKFENSAWWHSGMDSFRILGIGFHHSEVNVNAGFEHATATLGFRQLSNFDKGVYDVKMSCDIRACLDSI